MTFAALDDLPPVDVAADERMMVRSLIHTLQSLEESIAYAQSRQAEIYTALTEVIDVQTSRLPAGGRRDREMPLRAASAEIAAGLRITERAAQARMSEGYTLVMRFTRTHAALGQGRITRAHASVIVDGGVDIADAEARAKYELAALDIAEIETPGRLRSLVRTIAEKARPTSIVERHRDARRLRGVFVRDLPDAMSELCLVGPSVLVHGVYDRLTQMGTQVRRAAASTAPASREGTRRGAEGAVEGERDVSASGDTASDETASGGIASDTASGGIASDTASGDTPSGTASADSPVADDRTLDQIRADILCDIALAGGPVGVGDGIDAIRGIVQVTVPVLTLAGVHDEGADLAGTGPIDPETARRLAGEAAGWDRVMTHPVTGAILATDRYRPTADLKRALRIRDEHCRFPGCHQPPWRSDRDHTIDAALGGETADDNLACLCRRHHTLKHASAWQVAQLGGGVLEWTSPTGLTYIDIPPTTLRFVPDDVPPPF